MKIRIGEGGNLEEPCLSCNKPYLVSIPEWCCDGDCPEGVESKENSNEMTLDEVIRHAEEVAKENQRVVDTGIVFDNVTIDFLCCDDTEVIEEHLANYQKCADEYRHIAEWLKELKAYKKQDEAIKTISKMCLCKCNSNPDEVQAISKCLKSSVSLPTITSTDKTAYWVKHDTGHSIYYDCSLCGCAAPCTETADSFIWKLSNFCPDCGTKMYKDKEASKIVIDKQCPKDVGLENTFSGEDCEREQFYNNCYHCWSTARSKGRKEHKGVLDQLAEEQNNLLDSVREWNKAIEKNGYVN